MKPVLTSALLLAALSLQGCVAAVIPIAAAGALGKKELDKRDDGGKAEPVTATAQVDIAESQPVSAAAIPQATPAKLASIDPVGGINPYDTLVDYALARQQARAAGEEIRSAILVENVSLNDPRTIDCAQKPMAVIIDVDQETVSFSSVRGLDVILQRLRASDIRIAWLGKGSMESVEGGLDAAGLLDRTDIILPASGQGPRKQEQRTGFAVGHCVVAIAGDVQTDFDELFDYLNDPGYATSLDKFRGAGWFLLPSPLTPMEATQ